MKLQYPKRYRENLEYRIALLKRCETNVKLQADVFELCRREIVTWCDLFTWTYNPRSDIKIRPWITYPYQYQIFEELENAYAEDYDLLFEKTRDTGLTWCVLLFLNHKYTFTKGFAGKVGSWKESYVDQIGNMDSHFEKFRFINKRLPKWMSPHNDIPFMRMYDEVTGCSIVGETAGAKFGSGGRQKLLFFDEFSKWDESQSDGAWMSSADITECRIVVSTPFGLGNKYQKLASGEDGNIRVVTIHWTMHPEKAEGCYLLLEDGSKRALEPGQEAFSTWCKYKQTKPDIRFKLRGGVVRSPWYDRECERRSEEEIAQELDINYLGSGYPFFDMFGMNEQDSYVREPIDVGDIFYQDMEYEFRPNQYGAIKIHEHPNPHKKYLITADASEGLGQDEASALVMDLDLNRTVAVVNGQYPPEELAHTLVMLANYYNQALVVPENKGYGYMVCQLLNKKYGNVYRKKITRTGEIQETEELGFNTNSASRPEMLARLAEEIRNGSTRLIDPDLLNQCRTFLVNQKTKKPEAAVGKEDGLVICRAIASQVRSENFVSPVKRKKNAKASRALYHDIKQRKRNGGIRYGT